MAQHDSNDERIARDTAPGAVSNLGESLGSGVGDSGQTPTGAHPGGPPEGEGIHGGGTFGDEGGGGSYSGAHGPRGSAQSGGPGRGLSDDPAAGRKTTGIL